MNEYLTKLHALQRRAAEISLHKDPDLSPEGQEKAEKRARTALKSELDALTREFTTESAEAKRVAAAAIPKSDSDTRTRWERARMLLDAGLTLHQVVAQADAETLHAIQEWGPTYLQAAHLKARPVDTTVEQAGEVDPAPLRNSIRNRWTQLLDGYAPDRIARGVEAEVVDAQFQIRAGHLSRVLDGVRTGESDLGIAMAAQMAGQQAKVDLHALSAN